MGNLAGVREAMCVKDKVILLERSRTTSERRCDLAHAIAHIELGHGDRRNKGHEKAAVRLSAKMLIDLDPLGEALTACQGRVDEDCADLLRVDVETLRARLECLHPAERGYLSRRLAHLVEEHAA